VQIILVGLRKEMGGGVKMVTSDTLVAGRMNSKDFSTSRAFGFTQRIIIPILMQSTQARDQKQQECLIARTIGNLAIISTMIRKSWPTKTFGAFGIGDGILA
jgi:hypothetical protein